MSPSDVLAHLRAKGIALSIKADELVVRAAQGTIDTETLSVMKANKAALIALLQQEATVPSSDAGVAQRITPEMLPLVQLTQEEIDSVIAAVPGGIGNVQDIYPLAPLQEGILFHHLLEEKRDVYLLRRVMGFDARARLDDFMQALQQVINRHDILRTAIHWEGLPQPVQVVQRLAPMPVNILSGVESVAALDQLLIATDPQTMRLDLRHAPLLSATIIQEVETGEWLLALLKHHIVCDHITMELIMAEVQALMTGRGQTLPESIPYRNFIAQARSVPAAEHERYFSAQLGDIDEPTAPFGVLGVQGDGNQVLEARLPLADTLADRIRECARQTGVTSAVLFHVAWAQVLGQCSNRSDVVFGTVLTGRLQGTAGAERALGMFMNTLPVRLPLTQSVREAVADAFERLGKLLVHEQASLALAQRASGVSAPMPLFTSLLNYRHSHAASAAQGEGRSGWDGIRILNGEERTNYPLVVSIEDLGKRFAVSVQCVDGIDPHRVAGYVATAIEGLVAALTESPNLPLAELRVLPEHERQQLLVDFNATDAPFPHDLLIHELFERRAIDQPDAIALAFEDRTMSYGELDRRANRVAMDLHALDVVAGQRVPVCCERGPEMIVGLLGVLKAGAVYVPIDREWPAERKRSLLDALEGSTLLTSQSYLHELEAIAWTCKSLVNLYCVDAGSVYQPEQEISRNDVEGIWDFIAERAIDEITAGGFISSYTGQSFKPEQVAEYKQHLVALIEPNLRPDSKILEIGCGSGILAFELLSRGLDYVGVDPSGLTQERNSAKAVAAGHANARFYQGYAHEVTERVAGTFDIIVLASVVQFFPSYRYLENVIEQCLALLTPGGRLVIADVLDPAQKEVFQQSLVAFKSNNPSASIKIASGGELYIAKRFFSPNQHAATVSVLPRQPEQFSTELVHRYDVVIEQSDSVANSADLLPVTRHSVSGGPIAKASTVLPRVNPDDLAYIIFTSGSTGEPKGVMIQHRPAVNLFSWVNKTFKVGPTDRVFFVTSLCFDLSVYDIFGALAAGAVVDIAPERLLRDPEAMARYMLARPVTFWDSAPAAFGYLANSLEAGGAGVAQQTMRLAFFSGDWIPLGMPDRFRTLFSNAEVVSLGGATEAAIWSNYFRVRQVQANWVSIPYGKPIDNARYYVLNNDLQPLPIGVKGDLYIGGRCLSTGYFNDTGRTNEKFVSDPHNSDATARMYRTGDSARHRDDGNLEFLGRSDFQVKIRGFRVELGEIEAKLLRCSGVRDAVVLAREDVPGEKRLVAYVLAVEHAELSIAELRRQLSIDLTEYMVPSAFVVLKAFPVTSNGKLDRAALPAPDLTAVVTQAYEAPQGDLELSVAQQWQALLGLPKVGRHDSFFDLGGHSLLAMQVISGLRKTRGVEVQLRELFAHPTVAGFAEVIGRAGNTTHQSIVSADRSQPIPLSWAQQQLWFLDQLDHGASVAYHMPVALKLQGALNQPALQASLDQIIARHEILRTRFDHADGTAIQVVAPEGVGFALVEMDLAHLPIAQQEAKVIEVTADEARAPFDLTTGPLVRGRLLKLSNSEHVLLVTQHHIVSDGWSIRILVRELSALYAAFCQGQPDPLPKLSLQYSDYSAWQRNWLKGEVLDGQISYWRNQLAGAPALLELPTDRPRPQVHVQDSSTVQVLLPAKLSEALRSLSRRHNTTLFMTLLAGWSTLLARLSGQDEVVVGTPIANRQRSELEPLIGFFVNMLALRIPFKQNASVADLLATIRATTLDGYAHQDLPFEQVVEALQPARNLSHNAIYQVGLTLTNDPGAKSLSLPGLQLTPLASKNLTSQFDLLLSLSDSGEAISGSLEYATYLFDKTSIDTMLGYLQNLFEAMVASDAQLVSQLPLMSSVQRDRLLIGFNDTAVDLPERLIHQLFEEHAAKTPAATAVVFNEQSLSYDQLNRRANQLAHRLKAMGICPDDLVAICVDRGIDMIVAVLGVLKAGAGYVPLDAGYPADRLSHMLSDSAPRVLLTQSWLRDSIGVHPDLPALLLDQNDTYVADDSNPDPLATGLAEHHLAYVIYTSGSTGLPKGVMVEHRSICNLVRLHTATAASRVLQFNSFSFDVSVYEMFMALSHGASLVLIDKDTSLDSERLVQAIASNAITHANLPPALLMALPAKQTLASISTLIVGGEASTEVLVKRWGRGRRLINAYGPTEATVCATIHECEVEHSGNPSIGRPLSNTRIYILDAQQQPLPPGLAGELYIGGLGLARGYLNRPQLTAERFIPNPFSTDASERLYKTGDLARWLPDGTIEYLGRNDFQVKVRGFRIELGEVEARLSSLPQIREAVVLAREDVPGDKRLVAYAVPETLRPVELWPSVAEYYIYDDLLYQLMASDKRRVHAYKSAIAAVVKDKVVVEVGAGRDAILAQFCIEAGARKVYSIELLEDMYLRAKACIEGLGLQDRIILIHGDITTVELPEMADVCVSALVGPIGGTEGVSLLINSAWRLVKPDGKMVPERTLTKIAAVTLPDSFLSAPHFTETSGGYVEKIFEACGYPFDLRLCLGGMSKTDLISDEGIFEDLDHRYQTEPAFQRQERLTITRDARIDGFLVWLNLYTGNDQFVDILENEHCWLPVFCPAFYPGIEVSAGDAIAMTVTSTLCENGLNPDYNIKGQLQRRNGETIDFDYDSFHYKNAYRNHPFYDFIFADNAPRTRASSELSLSVADLRAQLKTMLPDYMVPSAIVLMDALPVTVNGKIDRKALPAPEQLLVEEVAGTDAPIGEVEEVIADLWKDLLGLTQISRNDHFFDLGGHSLLAIVVISSVRETLGAEVELKELFAKPTLAAFAAVVAQSRGSQLTPILPADRGQVLPLSWGQQRLWFLDQLDHAAGAAYHMPVALRLSGHLDRPALQQTLNRIVERHEVLRTRFVMIDGKPSQIICSAAQGFSLVDQDLQHLLAEEQATVVQAQTATEARAHFDLANGPLVRGQLLRLAECEHVLLITQHHIVSDGWSMRLLVAELSALYSAFSKGLPDPLPALSLQYADYAVWQRDWLQGEVLDQHISYWREQLDGAPALLELPLDRPRPLVQSHAGSITPLPLSAALTKRLRELSKRHETTLFMTLLAGWSLLLARLSGQSDVVVGMPVANRQRAELEPMLGFFVNTLALRVELKAEQTVADFLAQIKATTLDAYSHQDLPFEQVVEAVQPVRSMGHSPIFQAMLSLNNTPGAGVLNLEGLQLSPMPTPHTTTHFDLSLSLAESGDHVLGGLEYARDLFDASTIDRICAYFINILEAMVADDQQRVTELPFIASSQRSQLLIDFNLTDADYASRSLVHELFEAQASRTPEAVALICREATVSYSDLNRRADAMARRIAALGVKPDDRVAIYAERSIAMVVAVLGVLKAGAAYVPLDRSSPAERIAFMLDDCKPVAVLTQTALRSTLPTLDIPVLLLDATSETGEVDGPAPSTGHGAHARNLAYVIYTSGSTGSPKGVMVEHYGLSNYLQWASTNYGSLEGTTSILSSPLAFDATVTSLFVPLISGGAVTLVEERDELDGIETLLRQSRAWGLLKITPAHLKVLGQRMKAEGVRPSIQIFVIGGEALPASTIELWRSICPDTRLVNEYGPTETVVGCTAYEVPANWTSSQAVPVGRPIGNAKIVILDAHRQLVPLGVAGEIHIGGAGVARGYLNRTDLTAERFVADEFTGAMSARLYKSGDMGRWLPDGTLEYLGRNDFQVKIRGFRVELGEIEAQLVRCAGVREVAVIAREDVPGDRRLVAYVVADPGVDLSTAVLRSHLARSLADYMLPSAFVILDALPLTRNGKVDHRHLPVPGIDAVVARAFQAPEGAMELAIASLWQELLGLERVGCNDHFFELGGHSLLAVQLMVRIREQFHVEVSVKTLFECPVLSALCQRIDQLQIETYIGSDITSMEDELDSMSESELMDMLAQESE